MRRGVALARGRVATAPFDAATLPPPRMDDWVLANRVVVGGARPGPWRHEHAPQSLEIMRALSDPVVEMVSVQAPAQLLKSELCVNAVLYFMACSDTVLYYQPDIANLRAFVSDRIRPALWSMGMRELPGETATGLKRRDSTVQIRVPGMGDVTALTPGMRTGRASYSARVVVIDEYGKMADAGATDMVQVAYSRTTTFAADRKILVVSTPSTDGPGTISALWEEGSRGEWKLRCPHCGDLASGEWGHVKYGQTEEGLWDTGWEAKGEAPPMLHCDRCGAGMSEAERLGAVHAGCYVHEDPGHSHRSFRIPGAAHLWNLVPDMMVKGAAAYRRAVEAHDWAPYILWTQETAGRPWTEEYEGLSRTALMGGRWDPGPMGTESVGALAGPEERDGYSHSGALLVAVGADLGGNHVKGEWLAFGTDSLGQVLTWGLRYHTYGGGADDSVEDGELADAWWTDVMRLQWRDGWPGGGQVAACSALIDGGWYPDGVRAWCKAWQQREMKARGIREAGLFQAVVLPCKGTAFARQGHVLDFGSRDKHRDQMRRGLYPGQVLVDVMTVKGWQYESLLRDRRRDSSLRANRIPEDPGRFGYDEEWGRELTAEVRGTKRREGRHPAVVPHWTFRRGQTRKNHSWDCRIYAWAAAMRHVHPLPLADGLREMWRQRREGKGKVVELRTVE